MSDFKKGDFVNVMLWDQAKQSKLYDQAAELIHGLSENDWPEDGQITGFSRLTGEPIVSDSNGNWAEIPVEFLTKTN